MSDPFVTITKTEYTKIADASLEAFTAQCRSTSPMEVRFGDTEPAVALPGVLVPNGLQYALTRANGSGHAWAKLPEDAPLLTAPVVVIG